MTDEQRQRLLDIFKIHTKRRCDCGNIDIDRHEIIELCAAVAAEARKQERERLRVFHQRKKAIHLETAKDLPKTPAYWLLQFAGEEATLAIEYLNALDAEESGE